MSHAVAFSIVFILFYGQNWQGRVFRIMKNNHFLVLLAVWDIFPKFMSRLMSGLYYNCMK